MFLFLFHCPVPLVGVREGRKAGQGEREREEFEKGSVQKNLQLVRSRSHLSLLLFPRERSGQFILSRPLIGGAILEKKRQR